MFDCADDVLAYHNDEVTLPQAERDAMRGRRDANRKRLKDGLEEDKRPAPIELKSQGSYAMKTMVQDPSRDYDVDDGAYFAKEDLVGARGAEMSALDVRQMVRDAIDDGSFKTAPEVRKNCVRVTYSAGYHVDVPAYRRVVAKDILGNDVVHHELASTDWKRSDARDVTEWFEAENARQSPDKDNGRQLRRLTRYLKKFARSRSSWRRQILGGLGITKLVTECYRADPSREDQALYDTMKAVHDRLVFDLVVKHPVTPDDTITDGLEDSKARVLREKLSDALDWLKPLHESDCTRVEALGCWDKVFSTSFFGDRAEDAAAKSVGAPSILTSGMLKSIASSPEAQGAVRKEGGGRYA